MNQLQMDSDPSMIIFHYTVSGFEETVANFKKNIQNNNGSASQYITNIDGEIVKLTNDNIIVKHAGVSYWDGFSELNKYAIGIENTNYGWSDENYGGGVQVSGSSNFWYPFPQEQIDALIDLTIDLMNAHDIKPYNVTGHSDVAIPAGRKQDPGPLFPWKEFADKGIGLWYNLNVQCSQNLKQFDYSKISNDELKSLFINKLIELGYGDPKYVADPDNKPYGIKFTDNDKIIQKNIDELIKNYNMHYRQDKGISYDIEINDFDIINSLLCMKEVEKHNNMPLDKVAEMYSTSNPDYLIDNHLLDNIIKNFD